MEPPSEGSETGEEWEEWQSPTAGGDPGTVSNFVPVHIDWENSTSGEARRSIGGRRFLAKGESKASWDALFSDREGERILWWVTEAVVDTEEMDEVGEGGRGMSGERREREGVLEISWSLLERSR